MIDPLQAHRARIGIGDLEMRVSVVQPGVDLVTHSQSSLEMGGPSTRVILTNDNHYHFKEGKNEKIIAIK